MTDEDRTRLRAQLLGKNGVVGELLHDLKNHPPAERRQRGEAINRLTAEIQGLL